MSTVRANTFKHRRTYRLVMYIHNPHPLISVIVPFYSREKGRLAVSVESALNQSYSNIEIIVIDDQSPMPAADEIKMVQDNRIKILENDVNRNGAYSRNRGISEAKGEFIALLDADDFWREDHLETNLKAIGDSDFIYSNIIELANGIIVNYRETSDIQNYSRSTVCDILFDSPPQTNSFFFRRHCYPEVRFDERLNRHQDFQFFIDFCRSQYNVKKTNSFTSYYSMNERPKGKKIDYLSVINFWAERQNNASPNRLKIFLVGTSYKILKQDSLDAELLNVIEKQILNGDQFYKKIASISSPKLQQNILFVYYYMFLDGKNLGKKLTRAIIKFFKSKL